MTDKKPSKRVPATQLNDELFQELKAKLKSKGILEAQIISGSMEPLIQTGEKVKVVPWDENEKSLKKFDIVVFRFQSFLVCHYVWHQNRLIKDHGKNVYVTRALNSTHDDIPITSEDILGLVPGIQISGWQRLKIYLRDLV